MRAWQRSLLPHSSGIATSKALPVMIITSNGDGQAAYLDFLRRELIPNIETTIGGNPSQRILFGHSHGGSFALYALLAQQPSQQTFKSYLASDSSIQCMRAAADG